jgi:hypothetical protein
MKTVLSILISFLLLTNYTMTCQEYEFENPEVFSTKTKFALDTIRYFYYPNLEAYFDTKNSLYIYKIEDEWVKKPTIPMYYRGFCLYNNRYEVLSGLLDEENPEISIEEHKKEFPAIFTAKEMKLKLEKDKATKISFNPI